MSTELTYRLDGEKGNNMNAAVYGNCRRLPNGKAVKKLWKDEDGWWVILKEGYVNTGYDNAHTVNGETFAQLKEAMREVRREEEEAEACSRNCSTK